MAVATCQSGGNIPLGGAIAAVIGAVVAGCRLACTGGVVHLGTVHTHALIVVGARVLGVIQGRVALLTDKLICSDGPEGQAVAGVGLGCSSVSNTARMASAACNGFGVGVYRNGAVVVPQPGVGLASVAPDRLVSTLGVGQQQMVEIAAGLSQSCRLLILDEPTAALTDAEADLLFEHIRRLKASGAGVLYISHRLEEIRRIADTVTVLRNGRLVETRPADETDTDTIIRWMVGRDLSDAHRRRDQVPGEVRLRVEGLSRGSVVRDVSFEARAGEILGFAGLMGSGRTETMRAIFGADRADSGRVYLRGSDKPATIRSPRDAVRQGIALLTEDRKTQGLLLPLSVRVNATLTRMAGVTGLCGCIRPGVERAAVDRLIRMLSVRCSSREQAAVDLSGGNQQKVVIARWIYRNSDVLIFDEPTRGIDVGAKFEIYNLLSDLASEGKAVIVVSSDLKELLAISDRVAVMSDGKLAETFQREQWSRDDIMAAALSEYGAQRTTAAAGSVTE